MRGTKTDVLYNILSRYITTTTAVIEGGHSPDRNNNCVERICVKDLLMHLVHNNADQDIEWKDFLAQLSPQVEGDKMQIEQQPTTEFDEVVLEQWWQSTFSYLESSLSAT